MSPLILMFALNGVPSKNELEKCMKGFKDNKIDRFMLYPRDGCEVEYLSEDWWNLCSFCIDFAKEHGMKVWINDEYNYPSGTCKNRIFEENKNYYAKNIYVSSSGVEIGVSDKKTADYLNPDVTDCFIKLTHEEYYKRFGEYFGNVIEGFYTDEPSFRYSYYTSQRQFPYYEGLFEEYHDAFGRNFCDDLIEFSKDNSRSDFLTDYFKLIGKRFKESYLERIKKWCEMHGVIFTGHLFEDDSIINSILSNGDIFSCLDSFSMPGIDEIFGKIGNSKTDISLSILQNTVMKNKCDAMAEIFALAPCSFSFAKRRRFIWYASSFGVSRFFLAVAHANAKGNIKKPFYFNNFTNSSPDFEGMRILSDDAEKALKFAKKRQIFKVALRFPFKSSLKSFFENCGQSAENDILSLISRLNNFQIPWRIVREDEKCDEFVLTGNDVSDSFLESLLLPLYVFEKDGQRAKNLIVKCYDDNSFIVINLDDRKRELCLLKDGEKTDFTLCANGVFTGEVSNFKTYKPVMNNMRIEYPYENIFRAITIGNESFRFVCRNDLEVSLHKREFGEEISFLLDGKNVDCNCHCTLLGDCFNQLYKSSKRICLKKGEHIIKVRGRDYTYLPAVLISGDFEIFNNEIGKRSAVLDFSQKHSFFKRADIVFDTKIINSKNDLYLSFDDTEKYCKLYIDKTLISDCAFAPYRFKIPNSLTGKNVNIKIEIYSSYAPLFGDLCEYEKNFEIRPEWTKNADLCTLEDTELKNIVILEEIKK